MFSSSAITHSTSGTIQKVLERYQRLIDASELRDRRPVDNSADETVDHHHAKRCPGLSAEHELPQRNEHRHDGAGPRAEQPANVLLGFTRLAPRVPFWLVELEVRRANLVEL